MIHDSIIILTVPTSVYLNAAVLKAIENGFAVVTFHDKYRNFNFYLCHRVPSGTVQAVIIYLAS